MLSRLFLLLSLFVLVACDSGEPNRLSLDDYEGGEGEAVVRHMLKTLPAIDPEVPKVYTVVKGPNLQSTGMPFVRRMEDTKVTFISGEVLTMREPDKSIIDPRSGLSPVTIQLDEIKRTGTDAWEVIAGWAYKKTYERYHYKLIKKADGYAVTETSRLEGNYVKPSGDIK
ncbi:MAG: hypothetical protein RL693_2822 [Verrucomicrobiota bacterium]|jgi:hypothetical protein